jgi:hypothetical protein
MLKLSYEEWADTYRPIQNPHDDNASHEGRMFETHGIDYQFIKAHPNHAVWTLIDEGDLMWIVSGCHFVNRMGYFITEKEHDGTHIEIDLFTAENRFDNAVDNATHSVILQFDWLDFATEDARSALMVELNDAISTIMKQYDGS